MTSPVASSPVPVAGRRQRTFLGHPVGLYVLFFTEMWERFSFYGMRALLTLYMIDFYKWTQEESSTVYKWYTSLVYLTPLLGGFLADRFLGNKRAVIIGAILMAIGHFLMAFEPLPAFYAALVFLIMGNGFFKPNMSTQVGRLYPRNDARRDGAYTIFYMGINLGAFLSPLICGWLAENTVGRWHSGFAAAGVGMVLGLVVYLVGLPWILEVIHEGKDEAGTPAGEPAAGSPPAHPAAEMITIRNPPHASPPEPSRPQPVVQPRAEQQAPEQDETGEPLSEEVAERTLSTLPFLNRIAPRAMMVLGVVLALAAPVLGIRLIAWNTVIGLEIAAICSLISAWITSRVHQAVRDRVLAIYVLGIFVVFFWAAFEQAGNAMNVWADKVTDRHLTSEATPPPLYPEVEEKKTSKDETVQGGGFWEHWRDMFKLLPRKTASESSGGLWQWWVKLWNPVPTAWFQSINALAIFTLAPLFAALWIFLARHGWNPSIPTKMALGVLLMALAFGVMIGGAARENQPSSAFLLEENLPDAIKVNDAGQLCHQDKTGKLKPYFAGRLYFDPAAHTLHIRGVLPDIERDRIVRDTVPGYFAIKFKILQEWSQEANEDNPVTEELEENLPGFDLRYTGLSKAELSYDPSKRTLTTRVPLGDKDVRALLVASGDPHLRDTLNELLTSSSKYRVSSWWLFWFYILSTLGELCLSPVGLSMVSKLAPAKFATMLMGLWLLTSFFGNFAAGAFGEIADKVAPTRYFMIFLLALGGASLVLFVLVRKVVAMMHGVK